MKVWALTEEFSEGKYLVVRRDGTTPAWPHFVIGANDPSSDAALRAYAVDARDLGRDPAFCDSVEQLADHFARWRVDHADRHKVADPDAGPHRSDNPTVLAMMRGEFDLAYLIAERDGLAAPPPQISEPVEAVRKALEAARAELQCISGLRLIKLDDANSRGYDEALGLCQEVANRGLATLAALSRGEAGAPPKSAQPKVDVRDLVSGLPEAGAPSREALVDRICIGLFADADGLTIDGAEENWRRGLGCGAVGSDGHTEIVKVANTIADALYPTPPAPTNTDALAKRRILGDPLASFGGSAEVPALKASDLEREGADIGLLSAVVRSARAHGESTVIILTDDLAALLFSHPAALPEGWEWVAQPISERWPTVQAAPSLSTEGGES